MENKKPILRRYGSKDIELGLGDKVYKVYFLNNETIANRESIGEIVKITKTDVKVAFGESVISFSFDFSKTYKPNEYFMGRNESIVSEKEYLVLKAQSDEKNLKIEKMKFLDSLFSMKGGYYPLHLLEDNEVSNAIDTIYNKLCKKEEQK